VLAELGAVHARSVGAMHAGSIRHDARAALAYAVRLRLYECMRW
jgi:hypothetical protein